MKNIYLLLREIQFKSIINARRIDIFIKVLLKYIIIHIYVCIYNIYNLYIIYIYNNIIYL